MFLIITMERQGTLTVLNNPSQTKIIQTAASSFIFAFSALIEGLEVDKWGRVLIRTVLTCRGSHPKLIFWVEFLERDVGVLWWGKGWQP